MKSQHKLMVELMILQEEYRKLHSEDTLSLENFLLWSSRSVLLRSAEPAIYSSDEENKVEEPNNIHEEEINEYLARRVNVQLTTLLYHLSKHFKIYSKKILSDSDLVSIDGHMFLSTLYHSNGMTKTQLISAHHTEMPSGIEVIKRLLKKGFIEESDNPNDRRSKLVKISEKGRKEYLTSLPEYRKAVDLLAANLQDDKIITLTSLLSELNDKHVKIHSRAKKESLDDLLIYFSDEK